MSNEREENKKLFGLNEYQKVHDLVYKYQAGDFDAGEELIDSFAMFFTKYVSLIKFGKYDLNHYSTRSFIKLFVEDPADRKKVNPYINRANNVVVKKTVELIVKLFEASDHEDIQQDLKSIFLTMCKKYKDTRPSFHDYVSKNFHFYAYRHFEKMTKDPVACGYTYSHKSFYEKHTQVINDIVDLSDVIPDSNAEIESQQTFNDLNLHYSKQNSEIPVIEADAASSVYENEFIDINWINGVTCDDIFKNLTPFERKIIFMWYVDKKTDTEIGNEFNVCRGTINKRRGIAKSKIEKEVMKLNMLKREE
jgi:DNA-directed RNA polymerase specialized sigma24 family protein